MKVLFSEPVIEALAEAPLGVRKAFFKQIKFLENDLHHPSPFSQSFNKPPAAVEMLPTAVEATTVHAGMSGYRLFNSNEPSPRSTPLIHTLK